MPTKMDKNEVLYAVIEKNEDKGTYTWRRWVVEKEVGVGYHALHTDAQVFFTSDKLATIRRKLVTAEIAVVVNGEIPEGCKKTQARIDSDRKGRPHAEKMKSAGDEVRRIVRGTLEQAEEKKKKFLEDADENLEFAIKWCSSVVGGFFITRSFRVLLEIEDEDVLLEAIFSIRRETARRLLDDGITIQSTSLHGSAVSSDEQEAASRVVRLTNGFINLYQYEGVEVGRLDISQVIW